MRHFMDESPFIFLAYPKRFKVAYGGRGSGKSWAFARALIVLASQYRFRVLCAREFQNSIVDSVHRLLCDQIESMGLSDKFTITDKAIVSSTGSEFLFKGLRHNINEIKSLEGVDVCWVEEAQRVSQSSWDILIPTVRKEASEIWITFNPDNLSDPTYKRFVINPSPDCISVKVNFDQNRHFPETLRKEMEYCKANDYDAYLHIWEGNPRVISNAVIFKGKYVVEEFDTPDGIDRFFYGADWGFSQDPTVGIRCYIVGRKLFIDYECYGIGVEIAETDQLLRSIPGADKWTIKGDCSRPETISALNKKGLNVQPAKKWAGSVEDGIAHLRTFEQIVVHPRCKHTADEFALYSYKVDKITEEVLPVVVDKHNHCLDALRYSLDGYINNSTTGLLDYYEQEAAERKKAQQQPDGHTIYTPHQAY